MNRIHQITRSLARPVLFLAGFIFVLTPEADAKPFPEASFSTPEGEEIWSPVQEGQISTTLGSGNISDFGSLFSAPASNGESVYSFCLLDVIEFGPIGGSDCWGYTDSEGIDYAIMGIDIGIVFVNVTTMQIVDTVLGPENNCGFALWRDMATVGDICYAVSECTGTNQGLMVIDMSFLPDSVSLIRTQNTSPFGTSTSHNLSIDSTAGFLYVEGLGGASAVFIFDISNPADPTYVTSFGPAGSVHDMYASGDTVYVAEAGAGSFSIWDLSDKMAPELLAQVGILGGGYVHNIWPTDDRRHIVTTEETAFRTVKIWNIEDMSNIVMVGEYLGPANLAHNAQVKGDTLYLSHYESGVLVVDISTPSIPELIAGYDTWPTNNPAYNGAWGVYPFSSNGYIYASNDNGRLYVFQEGQVVIDETLSADSIGAEPGTQVKVAVSVENSRPLHILIVPITWDGPSGLIFDSISRVGTRTENFESLDLVGFDPFSHSAAYRFTASSSGDEELQPGFGPIFTAHFTVPVGAVEAVNPISFSPASGASLAFGDKCGVVSAPEIVSGEIEVCVDCGSCCLIPGDANNSGSVNIADATFLIAFIFSGGIEPICVESGDPNTSGSINISDATFLIAMIFSGGPVAECGPPPVN